eukprot:TRINITY_DN56396_c0_g1_i1.p1 TRINITY_DN56396_c0_g1~~TRINITY_DN56396_c0_g1_i1.p1  ORF type:complete len:238 (+),score=32.52 TRINITY_DN56396_c0_g1_i1:160-873(+)
MLSCDKRHTNLTISNPEVILRDLFPALAKEMDDAFDDMTSPSNDTDFKVFGDGAYRRVLNFVQCDDKTAKASVRRVPNTFQKQKKQRTLEMSSTLDVHFEVQGNIFVMKRTFRRGGPVEAEMVVQYLLEQIQSRCKVFWTALMSQKEFLVRRDEIVNEPTMWLMRYSYMFLSQDNELRTAAYKSMPNVIATQNFKFHLETMLNKRLSVAFEGINMTLFPSTALIIPLREESPVSLKL